MKRIDWAVERLLPREVAPLFRTYNIGHDHGFEVAAFGWRLIVSRLRKPAATLATP